MDPSQNKRVFQSLNNLVPEKLTPNMTFHFKLPKQRFYTLTPLPKSTSSDLTSF